CWPTGSMVFGTIDYNTDAQHITWTNGMATCMVADGVETNTDDIITLQAGGQTLRYSELTGDVTRPDGTMIQVAPHEQDCLAFRFLLQPLVQMCATGKCP